MKNLQRHSTNVILYGLSLRVFESILLYKCLCGIYAPISVSSKDVYIRAFYVIMKLYYIILLHHQGFKSLVADGINDNDSVTL